MGALSVAGESLGLCIPLRPLPLQGYRRRRAESTFYPVFCVTSSIKKNQAWDLQKNF